MARLGWPYSEYATPDIRRYDRYTRDVELKLIWWDHAWQNAKAAALISRGKEYVRLANRGKRRKRRGFALQGEKWINEGMRIRNRRHTV